MKYEIHKTYMDIYQKRLSQMKPPYRNYNYEQWHNAHLTDDALSKNQTATTIISSLMDAYWIKNGKHVLFINNQKLLDMLHHARFDINFSALGMKFEPICISAQAGLKWEEKPIWGSFLITTNRNEVPKICHLA